MEKKKENKIKRELNKYFSLLIDKLYTTNEKYIIVNTHLTVFGSEDLSYLTEFCRIYEVKISIHIYTGIYNNKYLQIIIRNG